MVFTIECSNHSNISKGGYRFSYKTLADPTPCDHTVSVKGCTHCEYNMGCTLPISCTHDNYHPGCFYCDSTEGGSSSDENIYPSEYPDSDDNKK